MSFIFTDRPLFSQDVFDECLDEIARIIDKIGRFLFNLVAISIKHLSSLFIRHQTITLFVNKKLSYRRGTARCVVSIEILPIAMQQCRNYLYDKS